MDIDLADELVNSKIVHIGLLLEGETMKIREVFDFNEDFKFDMIVLLQKV